MWLSNGMREVLLEESDILTSNSNVLHPSPVLQISIHSGIHCVYANSLISLVQETVSMFSDYWSTDTNALTFEYMFFFFSWQTPRKGISGFYDNHVLNSWRNYYFPSDYYFIFLSKMCGIPSFFCFYYYLGNQPTDRRSLCNSFKQVVFEKFINCI